MFFHYGLKESAHFFRVDAFFTYLEKFFRNSLFVSENIMYFCHAMRLLLLPMNELCKKLRLLFAALFVLQMACAHSFIFRNLSREGGLTDQLVSVIHQDQVGQIWMGTASNIVRYDGVHTFEYHLAGSLSQRKRVQAIVSGADMTVWAGNGDGLWRLSPRDTAFVQALRMEIPLAVNALALDEVARRLYIGTERGLYILNLTDSKVTRKLVNANELSAQNSVNGLLLGEDGCLWLAAGEGLHALRPGSDTWSHYYAADAPGQGFHNVTQAGGKIFIGSLDQGLFILDEKIAAARRYLDLDCPVVYGLSPDGSGNIYVGTDGNGVFKIDTRKDSIVQHFHQGTAASDISSNSVYSVLCDRRGQLWVGSYQSGVDHSLYQSLLIGTFSIPGFNTQDLAVRAFAKHGNQYLIGYRGGLCFIDTDHGIVYQMGPQQLKCQIVFSLCYLDGSFYVGTYGGGMFVFDPQTLTLRPFVPSGGAPLGEREIFCITLGPDSSLWVGAGGGVYNFGRNGSRLSHFSSQSSALPKGNVYEIFFDSSHRGWICTQNGMCIYDEASKSLRTDLFPDGFVNRQQVRDVFEDSRHRLFFVSDPGGVSVWDLQLQETDTAGFSPRSTPDAMFVIENPAGKLWVGTKYGLYSFGSAVQSYNFADGLNNEAFTFCQPVVDERHRLWMGSEAGLLYVDAEPDSLLASATSSRYVTGLVLDGVRQSLSMADLFGEGCISLSTKPYEITFLLSELSFTSDKAMRYEYRLDGVDKEWRQLTGASQVTYHGLGWGRRTFRVRNSAAPDMERELEIYVPMSRSDVIELIIAFLSVVAFIFLLLWLYRNKRLVTHLFDIIKRELKWHLHHAPGEKSEDEGESGDNSMQENVNVLQDIGNDGVPSDADDIASLEVDEDAAKHADKDKYRNVNISEDECEQLADALAKQMREQKLYKNPDLKIADVAEAVGTTPYLMSYLLSQYLKVSYYDYVNEFRVEEFKDLVKHVDLNLYTLPALGEQCGFSSRASFFRNFKKVTGITPNEYVQGLQK